MNTAVATFERPGVPRTTLSQPTAAIGVTALATMLDRIARPDGPARDIRLPAMLTVRESCGGGRNRASAPAAA